MEPGIVIAVQPETLQIAGEPIESRLAQEIQQLWSVHSQTQTVLGRTKEELRTLRLELGRRLYEMKVLLASPGRAGKWSKFLSEHRIPRASADRYARSYEVTVNPPVEVASTEAIRDSAAETVRKVLQSIWPKLRQPLTDPETAYQFVCALVERCNTLRAEITDSGIAVRKPTTINSEPSSDVFETKRVVEGQGAGYECEYHSCRAAVVFGGSKPQNGMLLNRLQAKAVLSLQGRGKANWRQE